MNFLRLLLAAALLAAMSTTAAAQGAVFGGLTADNDEPVEIEAGLLVQTRRDGRDILEYTGAVVARRGAMTINADSLIVVLPAAGGGAFDRIEASGNVTVTAGAQRATASRATVDMVGQTVVMSGNVVLVDGGNRTSGQTLTINLVTGGWRLETGANGRVQTIITPPPR